jgi:hypothetical protein
MHIALLCSYSIVFNFLLRVSEGEEKYELEMW